MSKKEPKVELDIDPELLDEALASVNKSSKKEEPEAVSESEEAPKPKDDETFNRLVRLTADFENYRKRMQKEKTETVLHATENLVKELLPVLDNFERALEQSQKSPDTDSIRTGVELILAQFKGVLERFGVRSESALGQPFDPLVHEAVSHIPSADHEPHTVMAEHQKAYFLHQRLLRPAMVTVAKEPEPAAAEEGGKTE